MELGRSADLTCVSGEAFALSGPAGDLLPGGDHGFYVGDLRLLDHLELLIDGRRPEPLRGDVIDTERAVFHSHVPQSDDRHDDPTLLVTRRRSVDTSLHEHVAVHNHGREPRTVTVQLVCGTDFANIYEVKRRRLPARARPLARDDGIVLRRDGGPEQVTVRPTPTADVQDGQLHWALTLEPRSSCHLSVDVVVTGHHGDAPPQAAPAGIGREPLPDVRSSDMRLERLIRRSLDDLRALATADPEWPDDRYITAGAPWYLTLFGRDALWSAFMLLPYGLNLAAGTLRVLARRQGTRSDPDTEEAPGKILHELRRGALTHRGELPATYFGTIDATPLFAILLHEAWVWGLPEDEIEPMLPHLEAALVWTAEFGVPDGGSFVEYRKPGGRGLDNQGWKDSPDAIQFADGRLADPPIALVEVQGYAYEAAQRGAELLEHFGRDARPWETWAAELRGRFHDAFWIRDERGPYLALALDGHGEPVDGPASNMGHVLTTGLLDAQQASTVARRLVHPSSASGWGLRTLATTARGFNPLGYHTGSVWPHDTAIAAHGCAMAGERDAAAALIRGLVAAAPHFDYRLPELFSGVAREPGLAPVPYPAACRPQAWAAASAVLLIRACLRPRPRLHEDRLELSPLWPPIFRRLELIGIPLAGGSVDVVVDEDRGVDVAIRATDVEIVVEPDALPGASG